MFADCIKEPVLPLTRSYMSSFSAPAGEPDYFLSSLGVALLKPRDENYMGICGRVNLNATEDSAIRDTGAVAERIKENMINPSCPLILYFGGMAWVNKSFAILEILLPGWKHLETAETFVKQLIGTDIHIMICQDQNAALVVTKTNSVPMYHLICSFLPLLFPAFFKNKPLDRQEVALLKTVEKKTPGAFRTKFAVIMQPLAQEILKKDLKACFKDYRTKRVDNAKREVENRKAACERTLQEYARSVEAMNNAMIVYEGLRSVMSDGYNEQEQEIIEYLGENRRVSGVQYLNGVLSFFVQMPLVNFDLGKWNNAVGYRDIYNNYKITDPDSPFNKQSNRKLLLDALFGSANPSLSVRLWGHMNLDLFRNIVKVDTPSSIPETLNDCLQNPHYKYHHCMGNASTHVVQALSRSDIISAIECAVAAVGNVNISETEATFRPMVAELFNSKDQIIQRSDGRNLTPAEALLWLTGKDKTE